MEKERVRLIVGGLLFAGMLVLYAVTAGRYPIPGEPAGRIVMHLGWHPFSPLDHPWWGACVQLLHRIPVFSLVVRLHLFSALCGAGAVTIVYGLVSGFSFGSEQGSTRSDKDHTKIRVGAGLFAGLSLGLCIPFWAVSTRSHPLSFDILLLLVLIVLCRSVLRTRSMRLLYLATFLAGVGITEFATLLLLLPLFLILALYVACAGERRLPRKKLGLLAGCFLAGSLGYVYTAWTVWQSPSALWRGWESFGAVQLQVWRHQYVLLAKIIPRHGWLLILITTILPLALVRLSRSGMHGTRRGPSRLLHGACTLVALLILLNTVLSPWGLLGWRPLVVTPYVFVALWSGYLAGYWMFVFRSRVPNEIALVRTVRQAAGFLWLPLLLIFTAYAAVRNFPCIDTRAARPLAAWADALVDQSRDRTWLLSRTGLEDLVQLAAYQQGRDLHIVNSAYAHARSYRGYLASLFENPRLKGLSQVGIGAVFTQALRTQPEFAKRLAVTSQADLFTTAGLNPIPYPLFFSGHTEDTLPDSNALFAQHTAAWSRGAQLVPPPVHGENPLAGYIGPWRMVQSKIANNLGVYLEEQSQPVLAIQAYRQARVLDEHNVSALLNLYTLSDALPLAESQALQKEFDTLGDLADRGYRLWSLSYHYGYVRHPEAYLHRGLSWAVSGKPRLAVRELQRAMAMGQDNQRMQLSLASLYYADRNVGTSRAVYQQLIEEDPQNPSALQGLSRIAVLEGDFDTARNYLQRLQEVTGDSEARRLEEAALEFALGNLERAKAILDQVLKANPKQVRAWTGRALIAARERDDNVLDQALQHLRNTAALPPELQLACGQLLASRGQTKEALQVLTALLDRHPGNTAALEFLLRLRVRQGNRVETKTVMEKLLRADQSNAYGNLVMGSIQYAEAEYDLAESAFRASLEADRTVEALNSLAWVLQMRGALDAALALVEEAVALSPIDGPSFDTLAMIKFKQKEWADAERAGLRALELQPESADTRYHLALIYEARNNLSAALPFMEEVARRLVEFPPDRHGRILDDLARMRKR